MAKFLIDFIKLTSVFEYVENNVKTLDLHDGVNFFFFNVLISSTYTFQVPWLIQTAMSKLSPHHALMLSGMPL